MGEMRSYLIVANETLSGEPLRAAIAERVAGGAARFYVVVPATPITHGLTWDEEETKNAAETRLGEIITHLQSVGAEAEGEVGVRDPVPLDAAVEVARVHEPRPSAVCALGDRLDERGGLDRRRHRDDLSRLDVGSGPDGELCELAQQGVLHAARRLLARAGSAAP